MLNLRANYYYNGVQTAQAVQRHVTGCRVWESNPGRGEFSSLVQTSLRARPASYTTRTGTMSGLKRPKGGVDYLPHLGPRLKKEKSHIVTSPQCLHGVLDDKLCLHLYTITCPENSNLFEIGQK